MFLQMCALSVLDEFLAYVAVHETIVLECVHSKVRQVVMISISSESVNLIL